MSVLQTLSGGNSFIIGYHEAFTEKVAYSIRLCRWWRFIRLHVKTKRNKNIISEKLVLKWFIQWLCVKIYSDKILHRDLKLKIFS